MTTKSPVILSAQASAARMKRIKADHDFYSSLEYDRTRYSEDVAVAARIFLIALRNAVHPDPHDGDTLSSADNADRSDRRAAAAGGGGAGKAAVPGGSTPSKPGAPGASAGGNASVADRRRDASGAASNGDAASRGTKRPAASSAGPAGSAATARNAASQKQKKAKRSPSGSNAGSSGGDSGLVAGAGPGVSDGSNGRNSIAGHQQGANGNGVASTIPPKSDVACRVKEDGKASWILAKVSRYVSEAKKYEVMDSGDDEKVKTHLVFKKHIRVLPKKPYDFAIDERVLAVYPDTTVFYPATVKGRRGKHIHCLFDEEEDTKNPTKEVDARFVIRPEPM